MSKFDIWSDKYFPGMKSGNHERRDKDTGQDSNSSQEYSNNKDSQSKEKVDATMKNAKSTKFKKILIELKVLLLKELIMNKRKQTQLC